MSRLNTEKSNNSWRRLQIGGKTPHADDLPFDSVASSSAGTRPRQIIIADAAARHFLVLQALLWGGHRRRRRVQLSPRGGGDTAQVSMCTSPAAVVVAMTIGRPRRASQNPAATLARAVIPWIEATMVRRSTIFQNTVTRRRGGCGARASRSGLPTANRRQG